MTLITHVRRFGPSLIGAALLSACATTTRPPRELVDARSAYTQAQSGPASRVQSDSLVDARVALSRAERAYAASADDLDIRTLAYVAERKAELANVKAHDAMNTQEQKQAELDIQEITQRQTGTTLELEREQPPKSNGQGLEVREQTREIVITLPGQVLFATGKSALMPGAHQKLDQVVDMLEDEPDRHVVIEGYTDATGSDAKNQVLSRRRAQSVKDYLTANGVPADRVSARGMGSSHPVASNDSPEGRANNRRVEIIIEPSRQRGKHHVGNRAE
jgi:outer membrane protein OmpA-like peptidoglycan-associated protein